VIFSEIRFKLPDWVAEFISGPGQAYRTVEERMHLVIELSRLNIEYGTGGPFGAGVFDEKTNKLFAPGINLVVQTNCSVIHAEILAIMIAQQKIKHYDLGREGMASYELVASTEPCTMCKGAITWSGIRKIVFGARREDAHKIGFDEGPKLLDWTQELEKRGIIVVQDICRDEASSVLQYYLENGGIIYNGRQNKG